MFSSWIRPVSVALLLFMQAGGILAQSKLFRLVLVDPPAADRPLPKDVGFDLVVADAHLNHNYYSQNGELSIDIPPAMYHSGHIHLAFRDKNTDFVFLFSRDSIVDLTLDPATIQVIPFIRKTDNPFNQVLLSHQRLDSLRLAEGLYNGFTRQYKNFALLSATDKRKKEQAFTDSMATRFLNTGRTKGYRKILAEYFKNRELIDLWTRLDNDFREIRTTIGPHAFYEALFLDREKTTIQYFCNLLLSPASTFSLSADERSNLANINTFLLSPEVAPPGDLLDVRRFYNSVARYVGSVINETISPVATSGYNSVNLIGKLGGLDVTNLANSLSDFLIKRARSDLEISFFNKFDKELSDTLIGRLFPATQRQLVELETYGISAAGNFGSLRLAIHSDLRAFPFGLHNLLVGSLKNSSSVYWVEYDNVCTLYSDTAAVHNIAAAAEDPGKKDYKNLLRLLAYHLRNGNQNDQFLPVKDLLLLDGVGQKYFVFLLYQYSPHLFGILDALNTHRGFAETTNALNGMLNKNTGYFFAGLNNTLSELDSIGMPGASGPDSTVSRRAMLGRIYTNTYLNFFWQGTEARNDSAEANYQKNLLALIEASNTSSAIVMQSALDYILLPLSEEAGYPAADMYRIKRFYGLTTGLVDAKTTDEVKYVMHTYLTPPTSYDASRTWQKVAGVYSFPGLVWESSGLIRATVPVGIAFFQKLGYAPRDGAFFLYAQTLDLASPLAVGLKKSYKSSRITIGDIVLPGVLTGYALKNQHLVFFAGGVYDKNTATGGRHIDLEAGMAVDVPLFWFASWSRK